MTFVLPTAQYLMTTNSSTNRANENGASTGLKTAGNLPITTNGAQFINSQSSSLTGTPERLFFGLDSQNSTAGYDMSTNPRVILTSVQYNAPNRIQSSTMANQGVAITVVSGTTEANNKRFNIGGNDTPFCSSQAGPNTICVDPTADSEDATAGTFDDTDVSGWGFGCVRFNLQGSSTLQAFFQRVFMFETSKNASKIPKFTGAGSNWDDAFTAVQGSNYTTKIGAWLTKAGTSFFVPCPFQFGDGSTATTFNDNGANITSPSDNATGQENFRLSDKSMRVYLSQRNNAADSVTISGSYAWGTPAAWDFDEDNLATCAITGATFNGMGDFTLGASVTGAAAFTLSSGSKVVINGADVDGSQINGDANVKSAAITTFTNLNVTGTLDFDTAGTYTIDSCAFGTVTNTSGGAVILNLVNSSTITTNSGPSITVNNPKTITLTNIKNPTEVRVYTAGTATEVGGQENVTSGTFTTSVEVSAVDVVIHALGFTNIRISNVATTSNVSIPIQQQVDRQYENV